MKKILLVGNHDVVIYNFRKELIEALLECGNSVYIALPYGEKVEKLKKLGCKYIEIPMQRHGINPIEEMKLFLKYICILRKIKPDMLFTYTIKPNIYGGMAASICKVPYIVNITGLGTALEHGGSLQFISIYLYKIALKKAESIFFQNYKNMKFFNANKIGKGEYKCLPGSGVNLEEFQYFSYPDDIEINFVFAARLMKDKGIEEYLTAAETIHKQYPGTVFHICGFDDGNYTDKVQQYMAKKIVIYHGMVDDMKTIYKDMHCLIVPSYHEGMSNVILEAAACGRAVIASDIAGCREAVEECGSGYLFEKGNVKELIFKIEKFLNLSPDERKNMGLKGRKKMEKEFDRRIIVDEYMEAINKYGR